MIKLGYLDLFHSVNIKNFKKVIDILYDSEIVATTLPNIIQNGNNKSVYMDISDELYKYIESIGEKVEKLASNKSLKLSEEDILKLRFYEKVSKLGIFIEDNIKNIIISRNATNNLLRNNITNDYESIILKPIIFVENDDIGYISVSIDIYKIGVAILNFSIPIYNVPFEVLHNLDMSFDNYIEVTVPGVIYNQDDKYIESNRNIFEVIDSYSKYIFRLINKFDKDKPKVFENYTIIDYEGINNSFKNFEDTFKKIFWILNKPYVVFNEQSDEIYNKCINNYYDANKNCRIYVGSYGRMVTILGNYYKILNTNSIYISTISQLKFSIHSVIINSIKVENIMKKLKKTGKNINRKRLEKFEVEKYLNDANKLGFSSVNKMTKYIEERVYDFFPKERYLNEIDIQNEIVTVREAIRRDKINIFFVFISGIATVLFSYEPLCKVLDLIDLRYGYNVSYYSFYIWICIIIFIFLYILCMFFNDKLFK